MGGGDRQYDMCNDHHRLSLAVNKMRKKKKKEKKKVDTMIPVWN